MQGDRCAYCESEISSPNRHIEHFVKRNGPNGNRRLTFEWSNLFGSCDREESCGKYKDKQSFEPDELIKPDRDNPEDYLLFLSDGRIVPRGDLSDANRRSAKETLRVFNLDHERGPLRFARERAIAGYIQISEEFARYALEFGEEEWRPLVEEELGRIRDLPYATAIKHTILKGLP